MRKIAIFLMLSSTFLAFSQSKPFKVYGSLVSSENNTPLESATVYLQKVKDSSLITYTISDKKGHFSLEGKAYENKLNFFVSYIGLKSFTKEITLDKQNIDLGKITMVPANQLDEVVIKSSAPITIKKDTLEFNVKSFKTKKDANVEDLLKKLPGVEVDANGKIKVNGKEVNKILVNGKPFFGNDPTITTRSFTKDIIEKVQITDTKTKAQAFTGEESEGTEQTINLTIKKENNKGVFGRLSAGGGSDERYDLSGMFNWFDNDRRISAISRKNNINSSGFSLDGINSMEMMEVSVLSAQGGFGGGNGGLTTSDNVGVNFSDEWGATDISVDYSNSGSNTENESTSERENILPDTRYFSSSNSKSSNESRSNNANLEFEIELDSTLQITLEPNFRTTNNTSILNRNQESLDALKVLTNNSTNSTFNSSTSNRFSNNFNISKRFKKKGAYISLRIRNNINTNESSNLLDSETNFYEIDPITNQPVVSNNIIRKQITNGDNESTGFNTSIRYSTPLVDKKLFLNSGLRYSRDKDTDIRSTFDFDEALQDYDYNNLNRDLSTNTEFVNEETNPWVGLRFQRKKWSLRMSSGYVFRALKNRDGLRPELNAERQFKAVEANSRFRYRFNPKMSFSVRYRLNNRSPQLSQLQSFENISDPLNTIIGNPNLEPTNTHSINGGFQNFNFQKRTGIFGYFGTSIINNQIVTKTNIDPETLKRETTYANVNGNVNFNANINVMKSVKLDTLRTLRFSIGLGHNKNKRVNFNNNVKYTSNNVSFSPRLGIALSWNDIMNIETNYNLSYNTTKFDLDVFDNQSFLVHRLNFRTSTTFPKNLEWENNITYNYNSQIADGFQKSAWFWNTTVTYSMLNDRAFLSLKVYDLLNQNTNARRIATANYIEDIQSTVLRQYFMLSFSWKFNSLGKRGEQMNYGRRGRRFYRAN